MKSNVCLFALSMLLSLSCSGKQGRSQQTVGGVGNCPDSVCADSQSAAIQHPQTSLEEYAGKYLKNDDKAGFEKLKSQSAALMKSDPDFVTLQFFLTNGRFDGNTPARRYAQEKTWAVMMDDLATHYFVQHEQNYAKPSDMASTAVRVAKLVESRLKHLSEGSNAEMTGYAYALRCAAEYKLMAATLDRQHDVPAATREALVEEACQWEALRSALQDYMSAMNDVVYEGASISASLYEGDCLALNDARLSLLQPAAAKTVALQAAGKKFSDAMASNQRMAAGATGSSDASEKLMAGYKDAVKKSSASLNQQLQVWLKAAAKAKAYDKGFADGNVGSFVGKMADVIKKKAI